MRGIDLLMSLVQQFRGHIVETIGMSCSFRQFHTCHLLLKPEPEDIGTSPPFLELLSEDESDVKILHLLILLVDNMKCLLVE